MAKPTVCLRCNENAFLEPISFSASFSAAASRKNMFFENTIPDAITFSVYVCGHAEFILRDTSLDKIKNLKKVQIQTGQ